MIRLLTNPALSGRFYAYSKGNSNGKNDGEPLLIFEDDALAILTPDEQEKIRQVLAENKALSSRHTKHDYPPLRGFVYCGQCQRKAYGNSHKKRGVYFRCAACWEP